MTSIKIIIIALLTISLNGYSGHDVYAKQGNEKYTFKLDNPSKRGYVIVEWRASGDINVKGYSGKEIKIEFSNIRKGRKKRFRNDWNNSRNRRRDFSHMEKIHSVNENISVYKKQNEIVFFHDYTTGNADINIFVPRKSDIDIEVHNGGNITIEGVSGFLRGVNYNGKLIELNKVSGSFEFISFNGEIIGSIDGLEQNEDNIFKALNGDIELKFPSNIKLTALMDNRFGNVYSDFDIDFVSKWEKTNGNRKTLLKQVSEGKINGGGANIMFSNLNGDIVIQKK